MPKPKEKPKAKLIMVRLDQEQYGQFTRAAKAAGQTPSAWLRELGERAIVPPASPSTHWVGPEIKLCPDPVDIEIKESDQPARKVTAAEIAASIPGLRVGVPERTVDVGDAPTEEVATRPWLPVWAELAPKINNDPDAFYDEMQRLAPGFKPKQAFWGLSLQAQAAALDEKFPLIAE